MYGTHLKACEHKHRANASDTALLREHWCVQKFTNYKPSYTLYMYKYDMNNGNVKKDCEVYELW